MSRPRTRKRPISQINVVPYIDVTLVMLVVFMMTAPLLTEGVKVDLPMAAKSDPVQTKPQEPVVVTVNRERLYFLDQGPISGETLSLAVAEILKRSPSTPVLIKGDRSVDYGAIIELMGLLRQAGAPSVGLITNPLETTKR